MLELNLLKGVEKGFNFINFFFVFEEYGSFILVK